MATNVDYQQAEDRAHDLVIASSKLLTLVEQSSPATPQQFGAAIQLIDEMQRYTSNG